MTGLNFNLIFQLPKNSAQKMWLNKYITGEVKIKGCVESETIHELEYTSKIQTDFLPQIHDYQSLKITY